MDPALPVVIDQYGNPLRKAAPANFSELGSVSTVPLGRGGDRGFRPDEFLPELRGRKSVEVFAEMRDNNATVGTGLHIISTTLTGAEWRVDPADESNPAAQEIADRFAEMLFKDMSTTWTDTLSEVLSMLPFGWSFVEIVLKRRVGPDTRDPTTRSNFTDGLIGLRKLAIRPQRTLVEWKFDDNGGPEAFVQKGQNGTDRVEIPIEKGLLFRTKMRDGSPYGVSLLRIAYRTWVLLKNAETAESIGIDRDLTGLPVGRLPNDILNGTSDKAMAVKAAWFKALRDMRFNEQAAFALPSDLWPGADGKPSNVRMYDIELMSTAGTRTIDTVAVKKGFESAIASSMLTQFLLLGQQGTGSFALAQEQRSVFADGMRGIASQITDTVNRHLFPRLMACNGLPRELTPSLAHGDFQKRDLAALADFVRALHDAGAPLFPDIVLENALRELGGLTPVPVDRDDDDVNDDDDDDLDAEPDDDPDGDDE